MPDIPRLPWYETPIWLFAQLVAVVFGANLLALRWLRARRAAG